MDKVNWKELRTHYPNGLSTVTFTNRMDGVKNVSIDGVHMGYFYLKSGSIGRCPNAEPMPVHFREEILKEACVRTLGGCV